MVSRLRQVQVLSQIFRVLGDPTRLRIWQILRDGEVNVTELCRRLGVPQPTVSHHLSILRMSGLVTNRRSGKEIYYSIGRLDKEGARAVRSLVTDHAAVRIGPVVIGLAGP